MNIVGYQPREPNFLFNVGDLVKLRYYGKPFKGTIIQRAGGYYYEWGRTNTPNLYLISCDDGTSRTAPEWDIQEADHEFKLSYSGNQIRHFPG